MGLLIAACADSADRDDERAVGVAHETIPSATEQTGQEAPLRVYGCTTSGLHPHDSRDTCSNRIVQQIFTGLVEIDAETGEPVLQVARAIETEDATTWTVEIERGWTFHDGELVTAQSFVDAWNHAAQPVYDHRARDYFAGIAGYDDVQAGEADALEGLEIVDEWTFEITLDAPFAPLLSRLASPAFSPLPSIAYADMEAFARHPVGNGRYELEEFDPDREAVLRRYEDWSGSDPARNDEVVFVIYTGDAALDNAFLDVLAGALDVLENVPPEELPALDDTFGDRVVRSPTGTLTMLGLPQYDPVFADNVLLAQALSLAIDRQAIIDTTLDGSAVPATSLLPPVLDSHRSDACEACSYDPARARELFAESGGLDGPLTVTFNAGSGHEEWIEAVSGYWRDVLGIEQFVYESEEFAPYLQLLEDERAAGPFRLAWGLAYPSAQYALSDLFRSSGAANHVAYRSAAFDDLLDVANASPPDEADALYQEAEDQVLADMPVIPLWYGRATAVHSERVSDVVVDASTIVRVDRIRLIDVER